MLRNLKPRRRPRYGAHLCAVLLALLLLLSVSLLHSRLSPPHDNPSTTTYHDNPLFSDDVSNDTIGNDDKIGELDTIGNQNNSENGDNGDNGEDLSSDYDEGRIETKVPSSGYYVDHITGSIRRALSKKSIEEWDFDYNSNSNKFNVFGIGLSLESDKSTVAVFGSDDVVIDEEVRRKVSEVNGIEDALMLKVSGKRVSPLREGWGVWFEKKGEFLKRDKMFKSNLEVLNPLSNPMLQDPDGVGVTGLTRGDKAVQKLLLSEFKKNPFVAKKTSSASDAGSEEVKRVERKTLDENVIVSGTVYKERVEYASPEGRKKSDKAGTGILDENVGNGVDSRQVKGKDKYESSSENQRGLNKDDESDMTHGNRNLLNESNGIGSGGLGEVSGMKSRGSKAEQRKPEELSHVYADGKRWGYFPDLHPHLPFSNFLDSFFRKGNCGIRVFMVWNSPPWMYSVRHQRGLESLLSHHRDACVMVFSETIELDFFKDSFVRDGFKVAVGMPNLDELLQGTPTHVFASVWLEWRKTNFYPTHFSELVRLAALYKYGGIYLDSDIIVLNSLSALDNTLGMEDPHAGSSLSGAVMAFRRNSPFIMECLKEFYMTYDDSNVRWNGADLLTRVARNFLSEGDKSSKQQELKVQPSYIFFPIGSEDITSYFAAPATENEVARQDAVFKRILNESLVFHFWNSVTATLIPEPGSLVTRLIDHPCIRCSDVL